VRYAGSRLTTLWSPTWPPLLLLALRPGKNARPLVLAKTLNRRSGESAIRTEAGGGETLKAKRWPMFRVGSNWGPLGRCPQLVSLEDAGFRRCQRTRGTC